MDARRIVEVIRSRQTEAEERWGQKSEWSDYVVRQEYSTLLAEIEADALEPDALVDTEIRSRNGRMIVFENPED